MKKLLVLCAFTTLFVSLKLSAATFKYDFKAYPKTENGCNVEAVNLGSLLEKATGVKIIAAQCLSESKYGYAISIKYDSVSPLSPVSNYKIKGFGAGDLCGQYSSLDLCQEEIEAEAQIFQNETGLTPLFKFCESDSQNDKKPWALRIEAFGQAKRLPFISGYNFFGIPVGMTGTKYLENLATAIKATGTNLRHVVVRSYGAYGRVSLHYYAKERVDFNLVEVSKHGVVEQCTNHVAQADEFLSKLENKPLITYCGKTVMGEIEMTLLYGGSVPVAFRPSVERFASHDECSTKHDALISYYQNELKQPVLGGVCSRLSTDHKVFVMNLFEAK